MSGLEGDGRDGGAWRGAPFYWDSPALESTAAGSAGGIGSWSDTPSIPRDQLRAGFALSDSATTLFLGTTSSHGQRTRGLRWHENQRGLTTTKTLPTLLAELDKAKATVADAEQTAAERQDAQAAVKKVAAAAIKVPVWAWAQRRSSKPPRKLGTRGQKLPDSPHPQLEPSELPKCRQVSQRDHSGRPSCGKQARCWWGSA